MCVHVCVNVCLHVCVCVYECVCAGRLLLFLFQMTITGFVRQIKVEQFLVSIIQRLTSDLGREDVNTKLLEIKIEQNDITCQLINI